MDKIILAGYMGSGKTTIGKILSSRLGLPFLDLDEEIERTQGLSVGEIFKQKGEIHFRKLERATLTEILQRPQSFVLAMGGGTPCYSGNDRLLREDGVQSFYLKSSVAELSRRLTGEKSSRPMIANLSDNDLPGFIGTHLFERDPFYRRAKYIVDTAGMTPGEVASVISAQLSRA